VILALLFLFVGGMKLVIPVEVLLAQMPIQMPGLFVRLIGLSPRGRSRLPGGAAKAMVAFTSSHRLA
jgi:hypothetical protein